MEEPGDGSANITRQNSKLIKGKSVKFSEVNEEQHVVGNKKVVKIATATEAVPRKGAADSLFGTSNALSKKAARRRRFWRKMATRLNPRYWIHVLNKKLPIIHPNSTGRVSWDFFVLILVLYNAVLVPYQVGFSTPAKHITEPLNYGIDAIFAIDICANFRTAYFDNTATLIRDGRKIAIHYSYTWFPIDFIATIPFETLVLAATDGLSDTQLTVLALLRTPRLLRLARLLRFFDRMRGANFIRMLKLLFFMAAVAHWITCLWHLIFKVRRDTHEEEPWSFDDLGANSAEISYFLNGYLNSFLLMIGNDINPKNDIERVYCTIVLVIGACFYAIIVGNMSLLVNNLNPTASRHKFKKDIVNNTVRYLDAPKSLAKRIDSYFEYLTTYSHPGPDGMALVSQLPTSMFQDISSWMYKDLVCKVPLFQDCEDAFISQLVMRLKLGVFLPSEVIFKIGDVGHEMYFITKGHVAVMKGTTEMLAMLGKGGFFGELALLATARRTAQCVALSNCDLSMLMAHDLVAAMRDFPDSAAKVRSRAINRLAELQTAGNVAEQTKAAPAPRHLKKLNPDAAEDVDAQAEEDQDREGRTGGGGDGGSTGGGDGGGGSHGGGSAGPSPSMHRVGSIKRIGSKRHDGAGGGMGLHGELGRLRRTPSVTESHGGESHGTGGGGHTGPLRRGAISGLGNALAVTDRDEAADLAVRMTRFRTASDWSKGTLDVVAQVHAVVTRLTGKVESLQGKMGDIHSRLGKVEGQNSEAGGPRGRGLFGGPGGGEQRGLDMFDMN